MVNSCSYYTQLQRDLNALYPVADSVPYEQRKELGLGNGHGIACTILGIQAKNVHAKRTGEKRCPKKGEWYLSGAYVAAYRAREDLTSEYHIAVLVKTKTETITTIVEVS